MELLFCSSQYNRNIDVAASCVCVFVCRWVGGCATPPAPLFSPLTKTYTSSPPSHSFPSPVPPRTMCVFVCVCVRKMEVWWGRGGADQPQICGSSASLNTHTHTHTQGRGSEVIREATLYWSAGRLQICMSKNHSFYLSFFLSYLC